MNEILNLGIRSHSKASEKYVDAIFKYGAKNEIHTSIPIEYRRTGTDIKDDEINTYLDKIYTEMSPDKWSIWKNEQTEFWLSKPNASTTKSFFDVLSDNFTWCCATCRLPANRNFARRIQDLKEFGYTIATNTKKHCETCNKNTMQLILLPILRGGITGYETWSPKTRNKKQDY
jgi:hypothetical protein